MKFFNKILAKLGINSATAPPAPTATPTTQASDTTPGTATTQDTAPPPKEVELIDVVAQLQQRAAANPQKLNWKSSIVDLLKLLDIDSSFTARKDLARELECPAELMGDSAKMNIWLHKTVLNRIAANGGNVPKDLLD